jgi:hypothetical protein
MKPFATLPLLTLLAACASGGFDPLEGMPAALGETVKVGALAASPRSVEEDSRCPADAQCVQAGRLVVRTRLDGSGWSETVPLTLGEAYATHGVTVLLASAQPDRRADTPRNEYRFIFSGGG